MEFFHDIAHLRGTQKLWFFDVDDGTGGRHCRHQVGLPRQKRGQLQHVAHFGYGRALVWLVHIGNHGAAEFAFHGSKNLHAFLQAHASVRMDGGAVGFIERGFEHQRDTQFFRNAHVMLCRTQGAVQVFQHVNAAKQGERAVVCHQNIFNLNRLHHDSFCIAQVFAHYKVQAALSCRYKAACTVPWLLLGRFGICLRLLLGLSLRTACILLLNRFADTRLLQSVQAFFLAHFALETVVQIEAFTAARH